MEQMDRVVVLDNLAGGAAAEMFQDALGKLLSNVADVNTVPEQKRQIVLTVTVVPNEDREVGTCEVKVETKLAGLKPAHTVLYFGTHAGDHVAVESNPKQRGLFDETPKPAPEPAGARRQS